MSLNHVKKLLLEHQVPVFLLLFVPSCELLTYKQPPQQATLYSSEHNRRAHGLGILVVNTSHAQVQARKWQVIEWRVKKTCKWRVEMLIYPPHASKVAI